ncbi:hypothetical protein N9M04_03005 [Candidatus Actinomarina sp.]|nr:hypothetical protein [Candidatus Actinomarina sp.]
MSNYIQNIKQWNWSLLAVVTWFLAFITGVWADYGSDEGVFTIPNLLTGITALFFFIYYLNTRKKLN